MPGIIASDADAIIDRVERLRLEIKADQANNNNSLMSEIRGLRTDFTTLERGRLTRAEGNISDLRLSIQTLSDSTTSSNKSLSNKFVVLGAISMVVLSSFLSALFLWIFTRPQ